MLRFRKFSLVAFSLLHTFTATMEAVAAEPTDSEEQHFVGGAVLGESVIPLREGSNNGSFGGGLALSYAYRMTRPLELGLDVGYVHVREDDPDFFLPALAIRYSKALNRGRSLEFGLSLRFGISYQRFHGTDEPERWRHALGATGGLSPDLRIRAGQGLFLQVAPEVTLGTELRAAPEESMEEPWNQFMAAGLRLGFLYGL
ncbi:MAG: hypothetical protein QM784_14900 [Polyangiaceae bacterium]